MVGKVEQGIKEEGMMMMMMRVEEVRMGGEDGGRGGKWFLERSNISL